MPFITCSERTTVLCFSFQFVIQRNEIINILIICIIEFNLLIVFYIKIVCYEIIK